MDDAGAGGGPDDTEGEYPSRSTADGTGRKGPEHDEGRQNRYCALFENGQLVVAEFDCSAAMSQVERVAADTDDLVGYFDDNPAVHQRILESVEVTDVNQTAVEYYGADSKRHLAENMEQILTPESIDTWKWVWERLLDGETGFQRECTSRTFDSEERCIVTEWTVPEGHAAEYDRVYMTALDITERSNREDELEHTNELLDEFASVVSHDIATPLGVIENNAQLIELTGDTDHVDGIYDAVERIREMTDELLALAQEGGAIEDTGPVGLGDVARDAWHSIDTEGATLDVAETGLIEANRNRLRQLLENLLRNAVEHGATDDRRAADDAVDHGSVSSRAGPGEPIEVTVGISDDGFYVADDGVGIPDVGREKLFEHGFTTDESGTGLGLAIVRRIAEGHGWEVSVSENGEEADGSGGVEVEITGVQVYDGTEDVTRFQ